MFFLCASSIYTEPITFKQLLDSPLPPLEDRSSCSSSVSKVCLTREPSKVRAWPNFVEIVRQHRLGLSPLVLEHKRYSPMKCMSRGVAIGGNEAEIQCDFLSSAGDALDQLFDFAVLTLSYAACGQSIGEGSRVPDLATVRTCGTTYTDTRQVDYGENLESLGADFKDSFVFNSKQFRGRHDVLVVAGEFKKGWFADGASSKSRFGGTIQCWRVHGKMCDSPTGWLSL